MSLFWRGIDYLYGRFAAEGGDLLAKTKRTRTCMARDELLNAQALFVVTPGRSGTKSLVEYCNKHSTMYSVHAPLPWLASTGHAYHQGALSSEAAFAAFYAARETYLKSAFERDLMFFDGDCKNLPLAPAIAHYMPNAKFLHVVRNPKSFIKSGLARGYYENKSPEMWGHLSAPIELDGQIEKIAYFWDEANLIAEQMKADLGPARVQTLIADEMFAEQGVILRAFDAIGLGGMFHTQVSGPMRKSNAQAGVNAINSIVAAQIDAAIAKICSTRSLYFK
ncbi:MULTISPECIES: sulfotransferase [Pseudomonas]|uniref:Sulfotransferase n=1 Tax=Pseudomonas mosselii TaxID=78327 RepID=A0A5R8Z6J2_9PSED|nr:sulfotransferase [Pseudomonas mosselii]TLP61164.1 sulfotransferase [Pseudomonas mosselii]